MIDKPHSALCRQPPCAPARHGFTLLEVLVTLVVMCVLAALAMPPMESALTDTRLRSVAAEFVDSLSTARTEAAKRGVPVVLCPRSSGANTCNTGAADWNQGWVIFSNASGDGSMAAGDSLLSVRTALPTGYSAGAVSGQGAIVVVLPSGEQRWTADTTARTVKFTKGSGKRYVVISRVGRASALAANECTTANYCSP